MTYIEYNMKKIVKYIAAGAILAVAASCDLNLIPEGSFVYDPEAVIVTESDLNGLEAGVMAQFRGLSSAIFDLPEDIAMDYFNATSDYGNNFGGVHRIDNDFNAGNYDTRDNWRYPFLALRTFNVVINGAKTVPAELKEGAAIARGEAFTARAFAYLHMIRLFGKAYGSSSATDLGLPLVLEYDQNARPARATVKEVYDQIKSDLDSAAVLLAGVKGTAAANRPSIDFVNALYARYYIDVKDYANAASYAHKVIDTKTYTLASTAEAMKKEFLEDKGTEAILQFFGNISEGGYTTHTEYSSMASDKEKGLYYRPIFIPTKKLLDSYDAGDLRYGQWFTDASALVFVNGSYYEDNKIVVFKRFSGNPDLQTSDIPNTRQLLKPILISEMYLIAAEAELQSNPAAAKADLNTLQAARGASLTDATAATVQNEWYRETVGLGLRISCLKRWGLGYDGRPGQTFASENGVIVKGDNFDGKTLAASDYHFVWPVPTHEIQVNPNLVQNEGYAAVTVE